MDNAISEEGREKLTDALRVGQWPFDRQRLRIDVAAAAPVASGWSARGYFVSTVGRDEKVIREYIKIQEKEDQRLDQLNLWR
jgi:hypothetical protein